MEETSEGKSPFTVAVPVRIRDIDFAGHAHHSAALLYFEEARAAYWRDIVGNGGDLADVGYVLAAATLRYRERVLYPDTLRVSVRVTAVGRKHFEIGYEIRSGTGSLVVTGGTTQVMYDYERKTSVDIPERIRAAMAEQDGPFSPASHPSGLSSEAAG